MTDNGITYITDDIVQVQIPLPYALNIVNCYLLRGIDGWTMLDSGLNTPPAQSQWKSALNYLNITPDHIEKIVITHMHPDHFGMAGWWQTLVESPMPVYLPIGEKRQMEMFYYSDDADEFYSWMIMGGMEAVHARQVAEGFSLTRDATRPYPIQQDFIYPDQKITLGSREFKTIHTPGHSDGQLMFYDKVDELLLSGDHVLMKITPNVGSWPQTEPNPLGRFMDSLQSLTELKVLQALPGHKWLITDWRGRVEEIIEHHEVRLIHTLEAIDAETQTIYDISRKVFPIDRFSLHEIRFAMAETLAHLDLLDIQGKVKHDNGNVRRYQVTN